MDLSWHGAEMRVGNGNTPLGVFLPRMRGILFLVITYVYMWFWGIIFMESIIERKSILCVPYVFRTTHTTFYYRIFSATC